MFYEIHKLIQNKYYDEVKDLPTYIRDAKLFRHIAEDMPLHINKEDLFAGWYGFAQEISQPQEVKQFKYNTASTPEEVALKEHFSNDLKMIINFTAAHTLIDYGNIIENGIEFYLNRVNEELKKEPNSDCLNGMKLSLETVEIYANRFSRLAKEKLKSASDPDEQKRLESIVEATKRVPMKRARSFLEAVQSVWIMHTLVAFAERGWGSISIGRMDQYLYPLYKEHLAEGGSREEAKEILKQLFLLLDSYGDGACALNLGGFDENGNDMCNELTDLFIEVEKEMARRSPIIAFRINPKTPDSVLDKLIDFDLFKIGQPTFYSELACRTAVEKRGVSREDAARFSANSCMGLILPGEEFADMWGVRFNSHVPLELAANGGKLINYELKTPLKTQVEKIDSFEQLLEKYGEYFDEIFENCAKIHTRAAEFADKNASDMLVSALTKGCIESRKDRSVGCKYNTVTVETLGLINVCDALSAIKKLVFEDKKYTLNDFVLAARQNFEGYEELLHDILKCEKYGENGETTNAIMKRLGEMVSNGCRRQYKNNRSYLPSLHTIDDNVFYGRAIYTTMDGRMKGQPLNKNANPSSLLQKREHTSVVLSATALDQTDFSGGQPIDLYFDKAWFETKESRDKIKALVRTYAALGGLQFQVNSIDIELLEKAHLEPEKYPEVIVRKGGYSVRFNEMSVRARENFLESARQHERLG